MRLGFNNNVAYKGMTLHVQTEDSGRAKPVITTLLYKDGSILGSTKLSYADILGVDDLDGVVDDLMKEQHKNMLRRLKAGEFDCKLAGTISPLHLVSEINASKTKEIPLPIANTDEIVVPPDSGLDSAIRSFFGI